MQVPDGQIQQISDAQVQAPTSVAAPVTQITDGQSQAPTSVAPVTQIERLHLRQLRHQRQLKEIENLLRQGEILSETSVYDVVLLSAAFAGVWWLSDIGSHVARLILDVACIE